MTVNTLIDKHKLESTPIKKIFYKINLSKATSNQKSRIQSIPNAFKRNSNWKPKSELMILTLTKSNNMKPNMTKSLTMKGWKSLNLE